MRGPRRRGRTIAVAVGVVAVGALLTGGAVRNYWERRREKSLLLERREDAERRLRELSARCERAEKDEAYLDSAARRELGLVAVDEVEFHFTGGSGAQPEPPSGG